MKKLLLLVSFLAMFLCSKGQTNHLYFDRLDIKKGLPESYIRAIVEDSEGYMWIATQNGIVKYDGYNYKVYNPGSDKVNMAPVTNVINIVADTIHKTVWATVVGNGIFRYNRATDSFDQFAYPSKTFFQYFNIRQIDADGNLWGTINNKITRCVKFDIKTKQFEFFSKLDKGNNYINAEEFHFAVNQADGSLWFGTTNGLYRYNGRGKPLMGYLTTTDTAKTTGFNPVYQPPSQPGIFWTNKYNGKKDLTLACFDTKTGKIIKEYTALKQPGSLPNVSIHDIHEDGKGRLWFATDAGLSKLDRETGKFTNYPPPASIKTNQFSQVVESKDGKFWISPHNLFYFDPETGRYEYYAPDDTKPGTIISSDVTFKLVDHTNTLWLGFGYGGVNKLNKLKSAFHVIEKASENNKGYPGDIPHIISTRPGFTRISNRNGIYDWQNGTENFNLIYKADPGSLILDVCEYNDVFYMGTSNGFIVYDLRTRRKEVYRNNPKDPKSLKNSNVSTVFRDHLGIVWLALNYNSGLCAYNPQTKKITAYPYHTNYEKIFNVNDGSIDDGQVITIYEDPQNTLWIGTNEGSVNRFDRETGKFFSYYTRKNERMTAVSEIFEDHTGRYWVGTYLNGLFEFDPKKGTYVRNITEKNGLLYNSITGIKEDAYGQLWIGSSRGLTRLDPKNMALRNYKLDDILPGSNLAIIQRQVLADGNFVVSQQNGMAIFDPQDLANDSYRPIVHIENISYGTPGVYRTNVKNVVTYGRENMSLAHDQNAVTFNYIALHYENPEANNYAYKLDGYDDDWNYVGTKRTATYNNLSPGTYTFKVKATNYAGVWSTTPDSFVIIIATPWWLTWVAWLVYILLFAAAMFSFIRYRARHLIIENQALEEKVELRTGELTKANHELSEQQEEIKTQRDQLAETLNNLKATQTQLIQSEKMASLGELTAGIAHEIQNPLNFVNNFSEVSVELTQELKAELKNGNTEDAIAIADDLEVNLEKIQHHGKRAESIVKGMLQHSRTSSGERQLTNINSLADEFFKLSYHGLRAKDKTFNADLVTDFDDSLPKVNVVPQDIGRVLLNLFNNAFYAVHQKKKTAGEDYKPTVEVSTSLFTPPSGSQGIYLRVKDNGTGIPENIKEKIMQPFFTTKPTGEGTGLGLSLSYDIMIKGHGGKIDVDSEEGEYTEFAVWLPLNKATNAQ